MTETSNARPSGPAHEGPSPEEGGGRPLRLILTLGGAGILAGLLIVGVYNATLPAIEAHRAARLAAAVEEVLGAPDSFQTLYLVDGELQAELPPDADPRALERVHPGYRADGSLIGYAVEGAKPGFQDVIDVLFGYDPRTGTVLGMSVLRHMETPGLGDKIITDREWVRQFEGAEPPLVDTKPGEAEEPHEIDMITGATISARTVVLAINEALERWRPILDSHARRDPLEVGGDEPSGGGP